MAGCSGGGSGGSGRWVARGGVARACTCAERSGSSIAGVCVRACQPGISQAVRMTKLASHAQTAPEEIREGSMLLLREIRG